MEIPVIKITNVIKDYAGIRALNGSSLEVNKGEIFGLLGPNGAGKTTTLEIIEGLIGSDEGVVQVLGDSMPTNAEKIRRRMGVQLQNSSLPVDITVNEAINLFSAYRGVNPDPELIELFKLNNFLFKTYDELSGGQKKSLQLCLALLHDPELIILDEPTSALDVETRNHLHTIIKGLKEKGKTLILSTHDMSEAESLCDRIAILIKGEIVVVGSPKEVTAGDSKELKISVKSSKSSILNDPDGTFSNVVKKHQIDDYCIMHSNNVGQSIMEIIKKLEKNQDEIIDFRVERPSLEEKLLELIGEGVSK